MDIGTGSSSYVGVGYSVCFLRNIGKLQPRNTRPHVTRMSETRCGSWTRVDRPLFPPATLSPACPAQPVHKRIVFYGSATILTCTSAQRHNFWADGTKHTTWLQTFLRF